MTEEAKLVDRVLQEAERDAPFTHVSQDILKYGIHAVLKAVEDQSERMARYWDEDGDKQQAIGWEKAQDELRTMRKRFAHLKVE